MSEGVSQLYNKLFELERKTKRLRLYPIHKKLSLPNHKDIYDFLIEFYKFDDSKNILDAGCGVGYGSIKISETTNAFVVGISVSPLEIQQAKQNATKLLNGNCSFELLSFADVPKNTFDVIICVESLKHAIPIHSSVNSLIDGLKANGRLIVVDDFYGSDIISGKTEHQLIKDWRLDTLIKVEDLPNSTQNDITKYVKVKSMLSSIIKLIGLALLKPFVSEVSIALFRGGVYLDILYKKKKLTYLICEIRKLN